MNFLKNPNNIFTQFLMLFGHKIKRKERKKYEGPYLIVPPGTTFKPIRSETCTAECIEIQETHIPPNQVEEPEPPKVEKADIPPGQVKKE